MQKLPPKPKETFGPKFFKYMEILNKNQGEIYKRALDKFTLLTSDSFRKLIRQIEKSKQMPFEKLKQRTYEPYLKPVLVIGNRKAFEINRIYLKEAITVPKSATPLRLVLPPTYFFMPEILLYFYGKDEKRGRRVSVIFNTHTPYSQRMYFTYFCLQKVQARLKQELVEAIIEEEGIMFEFSQSLQEPADITFRVDMIISSPNRTRNRKVNLKLVRRLIPIEWHEFNPLGI